MAGPDQGKTAALVTPTTAGYAYTALAVSLGPPVVALACNVASQVQALAATQTTTYGLWIGKTAAEND